MNSTISASGTVVLEPTEAEYNDYLEERTKAALSMSVDEFRRAYEAGRLDESDAAVSELVALLQVSRNGR